MNDSINDKQFELFMDISKKVKYILEQVAWQYVKEFKIPCNHVRVDIIDMSSISILFINKSILGDKNVYDINLPYKSLLNPTDWLKEQTKQAKDFQKEVATRIKKRSQIQKKAKEKIKL